MSEPHTNTAAPSERVASLPGIREILELLLELTGLRIALVARVADDSWTCCAVIDRAGFGLEVGASLDVSSTY